LTAHFIAELTTNIEIDTALLVIMASQLTEDGHVIPPLNITAPAPIINLRGFKWDTVDQEVQGHDTAPVTEETPPEEPRVSGANEQLPEQHEQTLLLAQAIPTIQQKVAVPVLGKAPPAGQLPAPRLPVSPEALGAQLPAQLGLVPGQPLPPAPLFPLTQFQGAYAGNGFNLIFRPRSTNDQTPFQNPPVGPNDNILELNLTTEQLTFGETIGDIPNRGLNQNNQPDVTLGGFPYLQTIQDVTNTETGKGDRIKPVGIHFEPGMWLNVPATDSPKNGPSVVRIASIRMVQPSMRSPCLLQSMLPLLVETQVLLVLMFLTRHHSPSALIRH